MENTALTIVQQPETQVEGRMATVDQMIGWYNDFVTFSKSILKSGLDFGVIPKTNKPTLFKAGAEKLATAYGFGVEVDLTKDFIDFDKPFIGFIYKATVKNKTGRIISQCEGSCNSMETKYQKKDYKTNTYYPDPNPFNQMNTLQKMAQKRAYVGAVLLATGASEFFTQDLEDLIIDADYEEVKDKSNPKVTHIAEKQEAKKEEPREKKSSQEMILADFKEVKDKSLFEWTNLIAYWIKKLPKLEDSQWFEKITDEYKPDPKTDEELMEEALNKSEKAI